MTFVFIHGAGCTPEVWDAQRRAFPESIAPALPGHESPGTPDTIEAFADAVEREVENHDINEAILCGHSMGGAVALQIALRENPRIRGVVLLGSGAKLRVAPAIFASLKHDFSAAVKQIVGMFFAHPTAERIAAYESMMERVGAQQTIRDFRACDAFDASERIARIGVPVLAMTGERDVLMPPKFSEFLAGRIRGATARILPGAGHFIMAENPAETNQALRAFVSRTDPD